MKNAAEISTRKLGGDALGNQPLLGLEDAVDVLDVVAGSHNFIADTAAMAAQGEKKSVATIDICAVDDLMVSAARLGRHHGHGQLSQWVMIAAALPLRS